MSDVPEPEIPAHDGTDPATGRPASTPRRAVRWVTSLLWTALKYLLYRVPLYRRGRSDDGPPPIPDLDREVPGDPTQVQRASEGVGPLYHRLYRIGFTDADLGPEGLVALLREDINLATPTEMARFESRHPGPGPADRVRIDVGEELLVFLPGPWNGPVRVVHADDTSFTLATLKGHMEAGQITFRATTHERFGWTVFEIESFARSATRLFHLLYHRVPVASEAQLHMWASFCQQVVRCAGGVPMTSVETQTHVYDETAGAAGGTATYATTGKVSRRAREALDEMHAKELNFELEGLDPTEAGGWTVDDWRQPLPAEPPGPPVPGGTFEVAKALMADYRFADPDIVRAVYRTDVPLAERDMVLEARFYGLTFILGLRVGGVREEVVEDDGRTVHVWGWNYRTLAGHLETGQMDYEVWKWEDTGEVEFRIHAFSRPARIDNLVVRLGMKVFGRWMQVRFAKNALHRMAALVDARRAASAEESPDPEHETQDVEHLEDADRSDAVA